MNNIVLLKITDNITPYNKTKRAIAEFTLKDGKTKTIYFGMRDSKGTFFDGAPELKKENYIKRHSKMGEDWTTSGIMTPGFLSRFVLWEKKGNAQTEKFLKTLTKIKSVSVDLKQYPVI